MYMPIYPTPAIWKELPGRCLLTQNTEMQLAPGALNKAQQEEIQGLWHRFACTAGTLTLIENPSLPPFSARIGMCDCALQSGDTYALRVTPQGVCLIAVNAVSMLHALATLVQLLCPVCLDMGAERFSMDCTEIHDHPAMNFRALHLCVFPETSLDVLEKVIRLAAFARFSHIVLEFWGMLQLNSFPELAWAGRAYSQEQIKPLIALANDWGMEIIPMLNHLGHATGSRVSVGRHAVLNQNPRLALLFEPDGWTWCLSNPEVHKRLRAVREELITLCGKGRYFHLGCDEAYSFGSCPLCRDRDKPEMLANYLNGLAEELAAHGRRGIIWGDALLEKAYWNEKGARYIATARPDQQTHLALERLDRRLLIADWQYDITVPDTATSEHFQARGFDVISCPWDSPANISALTEGVQKAHLYGEMVTTWHYLMPMLRRFHDIGNGLWHGAMSGENECAYTHGAALLRKICPNTATFEQAGFFPHEVDTNYTKYI